MTTFVFWFGRHRNPVYARMYIVPATLKRKLQEWSGVLLKVNLFVNYIKCDVNGPNSCQDVLVAVITIHKYRVN